MGRAWGDLKNQVQQKDIEVKNLRLMEKQLINEIDTVKAKKSQADEKYNQLSTQSGQDKVHIR